MLSINDTVKKVIDSQKDTKEYKKYNLNFNTAKIILNKELKFG